MADGSKCYLVAENYRSRPTPGMSWDEATEVRITVGKVNKVDGL